jgi:hypothetical protein
VTLAPLWYKAVVEMVEDEEGASRIHGDYAVLAVNAKEARAKMEKFLFDEHHHHDRCPPKGPHVGVDKVVDIKKIGPHIAENDIVFLGEQ